MKYTIQQLAIALVAVAGLGSAMAAPQDQQVVRIPHGANVHADTLIGPSPVHVDTLIGPSGVPTPPTDATATDTTAPTDATGSDSTTNSKTKSKSKSKKPTATASDEESQSQTKPKSKKPKPTQASTSEEAPLSNETSTVFVDASQTSNPAPSSAPVSSSKNAASTAFGASPLLALAVAGGLSAMLAAF
ncbi:hypothetical protein GGI12_000081 [Dipsacomyces acuminosporus]|nr:hypothetical protein GGI12_000081 [Dipsacomyces acuminosporus]